MALSALEARLREGVPLAAAWGVQVLEAAPGHALLRLPADPLLLRPGGSVSGPALMGLADLAMWAALLGGAEGRDDFRTVTLSITFLRPLPPGPVLAAARVLKAGRTMAHGEVTLTGEGQAAPGAMVTTSWARAVPATGP